MLVRPLIFIKKHKILKAILNIKNLYGNYCRLNETVSDTLGSKKGNNFSINFLFVQFYLLSKLNKH
jgi:hypothetical protein